MDQVDIFSYHQSANSQQLPPSTSVKPKKQKQSSSSTNPISHFTPIAERSSSKLPQDQKVKIPTIQRQSRPREKSTAATPKKPSASLVPALHADQRVRQRSLSREPQPLASNTPKPVETKKIVAFGRTTTVATEKSANTSAASTSRQSVAISNSEATRLRTDIESLKTRVAANEQIQHEVEKLKGTIKKLVTKNEQSFTTMGQQLRGEIQKLRGEFDVLSTANSELTKRLNELETRISKFGTKEVTSSTSKVQSKMLPIRSYQQQPLKSQQSTPQTVSEQKKGDILYSCLPTDMNRQIQQINTEFRHRRHNSRDRSNRHNDTAATKRFDYTGGSNNDMSRRFKNANLSGNKENRQLPSTVKKALASNQIIELNDTYDKDNDFAFNEF